MKKKSTAKIKNLTRERANSSSRISRPLSFAKKSFGQNFLVDGKYIDKIISALDARAGETIIEIGAGRGALTERLVETGAKIIAVELDRDLISFLKEKFGEFENFTLLETDVLKMDFFEVAQNPNSEIPHPKSKLVANLPFYISTAILQKLIEQREAFSEMILMFQREVVERITAAPGSSERGFLTVLVEAYLETEKLFDVPPDAFHPAPKVWSSVARLTTKDEEKIEIKNAKLFREIISAGFRQKRKTIFNNLKNASPNLSQKFEAAGGIRQILEKSTVQTNRRAETLTLEEWKNIINLSA